MKATYLGVGMVCPRQAFSHSKNGTMNLKIFIIVQGKTQVQGKCHHNILDFEVKANNELNACHCLEHI